MYVSFGRPNRRQSARTLLRSDGEGSQRVGSGYFTSASTERLLQSTWRGHLTLRTGDTINGEMIREVIENVSNSTRVARMWQKSGRCFRTRSQNDSLGWQFQVSKEQPLGCHFAQNETIVPVRSFALPCLC